MAVSRLESLYSFYGAYHNNKLNKAIHVIFVWPIFASALILLHYGPPLLVIPTGGNGADLKIDASIVVAVSYAVLYLTLDPRLGLLATILIGACFFGASQAYAFLGSDIAWKFAAVVQAVCWISQFIGHGVFEKRAPALLDNLAQALFMAPFFVLLEVVEAQTGYEPSVGFKSRVTAAVEEDIRKFKQRKQKVQ